IAFGTHQGTLPGALTPSPALAEGPLRLVPFVLTGEAGDVAAVSQALEELLLETGMAGAGTALLAQEAFGLSVEHARYLTVHDLCAMTAMQYEHAGLGELWPIVETARSEERRVGKEGRGGRWPEHVRSDRRRGDERRGSAQ